MSAPKKYNIDPKEVEKLATYGITMREMADFFRCTESIISKSYSESYAKGLQVLKQRLRMKQIQLAMNGNVQLLIWLGKQYLEQKDKQDVTSNGETMTYTITFGNASEKD